MTPKQATSSAKLCKLPFDNVNLSGSTCVMVEEGHVSFGVKGANIRLTRKAFEAAILWYEKGIIPLAERRKR